MNTLYNNKLFLQTELAIAVDDADLFKVEVGEDILTAMQMFEVLVSILRALIPRVSSTNSTKLLDLH